MSAPPRPRALLFDWDNTLVDNWAAIRLALNEALVAMGQAPWTLAEVRTRVRKSARDSFPVLFGDRWESARDIFYASIRAHHLEMLSALPGADAALRRLAASELYLGVVSNKTGHLLRAEAAQLGWDRIFRRLIGAGDAAADKPATDPVDLVLEGSGLARARDIWFVGDAGIDMECARRAGCLAVLVRADDADAPEFRDAPPDLHVRDLGGLVSLVRGYVHTI